MSGVVHIPARLYYPYATAIGLKRLLGLSCSRHRSFFLLKVIRALERGRITGRLQITAAGKRDGVGAQALARVSARSFAAAYNLPYMHTPFQTLAHAELPMAEWLATWENLLDLGMGAPLAAESTLPPVDLETYAMTPSLWREDRLLVVRHYHTFSELAPAQVERATRSLRAGYLARYGQAPRSMGEPLVIRIHVRRGDVRPGDAQTAHRFTANHQIVPAIEAIIRVARTLGREFKAYLYSQGEPGEFAEFQRVAGLELRLNLPALETFRELVDADVLLMARSDFSHLAAMYGRGVKICDPRHRTPLSDWLRIDPKTGRFDEELLRMRLCAASEG